MSGPQWKRGGLLVVLVAQGLQPVQRGLAWPVDLTGPACSSNGSNQWELYGKMRFEMPYNVWCGGCEKHIRRGTRFNASKLDAGKYFSTKIYEFHMKCASCPQKFVIKTDPKNRTYEFVSGGRVKVETYTEEAAEVEKLSSQVKPLQLGAHTEGL